MCPKRFLLTIPLSFIIVAYQFAIYWVWEISPMNQEGNPIFIYALGWGPIAAILIVQEVAGYVLPNEDRELIRQRRIRGQEIDGEMGYTKKPHWWRLGSGEQGMNMSEVLAKRAREVGGRLVGNMTAEQVREERQREEEAGMGVELNNISGNRRKRHEGKEINVKYMTPAQKASARMEERKQKELADEQLRRVALSLFPTQESPQEPKRKERDAEYLMSDDFMDNARRSSKPDAAAGLSPTGASGSGDGFTVAATRSSLPSGLRPPAERQGSIATGTTAGARTSQTSLASTLNQPPQTVKSMLDI